MARLHHLARMTTSTTGFGPVTLAAAVSGHLTFDQAGLRDGDEIAYAIKDGADSELGRGVYSISGPTLTRNALQSTNNNLPLDLSGSAEVFITEMAGGGSGGVNRSKQDVLPVLPSSDPPALVAWRTSALSIPDITSTVITLTDTVSEQGIEMESSSVIKLLRYSAVEWYDFFFNATFAAHASNNRVISIEVRDITDASWAPLDLIILPAAQNGLNTVFSTVYRHVRGENDDAVRFRAYQDSGSALNLNLFLLNVVLVKQGYAL